MDPALLYEPPFTGGAPPLVCSLTSFVSFLADFGFF